MKYILRLSLLFAILGAGSSAFAEKFDWSYKFITFASNYQSDPPLTVSGTFDGTANGNIVTGITAFSLKFNGVPYEMRYGMDIKSYVCATACVTNGNAAVASFDGLANNFFIRDLDRTLANPPIDGAQVLIWSPNINYPSGYAMASNPPTIGSYDAGYSGPLDIYSASRWSMVVSVPEPETYALMLAGLGLLFVASRKRKSKSAWRMAV
ncbi:hypothetical protein DIC66_21540 [Rhodoferax lacus]|uniref:Ice-binding protein C-terminal domain-containing protein n=1 Tax=Rhodoferax lacus TaxID=2184758 RepID=A0A3E1R5Y1_9BURK|nr:PEP-CTERM sorting domain-containing protein [Rhodoferax lacus]RFO94798.1 hypothetical protein DIC66_21540 [Rhodoferax lacus]